MTKLKRGDNEISSVFFFFFFANSFIIKTRDGRRKAFQQDDVAHLKEGAFIEANTNCSHPPECITVRIEVNDPKYLKI